MTRIKSSVDLIPFLVPRRKVWLTPTARVPCSNTVNIGKHKICTQREFCTWQNSVRRQRPPKIYIHCISTWDGQTSWKVWLTAVERRRCSNEAKTRNPLKFSGMPPTHEWISAVSVPKFTILWGLVDDILLSNKFFFRLSIAYTCLSCEQTAWQSCATVRRLRFFAYFYGRPM